MKLTRMPELSPQEHVDARILAYYGSEFDEGDRLVGRSGQGVLEFERTQQIVGEHVPAGPASSTSAVPAGCTPQPWPSGATLSCSSIPCPAM